MKNRILAVLLLSFVSLISSAQDFSNKGTDFWVGYGLHSRMFLNNLGGTQDMVLYFATESVTTVTVSIPGLNFSQTYSNISANTIFTTPPLPKTGAQDARLIKEGITDQGIHIVSDKPIVAYAHIYDGNVSGATLLFPTVTLGKEYYSINFEQHANEDHSNCFFYAVAVDTGTTTIEVVPGANTQNMVAGQTYTFNLTQGQVFNALGKITARSNGTYDGEDLTGTTIKSISSGTGGCKKIAVFSGSGKLSIRCPLSTPGGSADNYMVQDFPKNAWGKNYLTVPTSGMPYNYFRIAVLDPSTIVKLNGVVLSGLVNNFYYQLAQTNVPNVIEADKPVMVAQYITTAKECGNTSLGDDGDPEVIYLSPVEQNIDKVIINSTPNSKITSHYINVVIPNGGTAISSFKIDGAPPSAAFIPFPQKPSYSYLVQNLSQGQHLVQSDSSFNAIAYGYGNLESYGYNAGANVKDLYQFISIQNQFATVNFASACKNSPFYLSMTFPYQPLQIKWQFNGLLPDVTIDNPIADSVWSVNGRQLYRYKINSPYSLTSTGRFPIKIIAQNPTSDGCSGEQVIAYDLQVYEKPSADFNFTATSCLPDTVHFTDNGSANGRSITNWLWDFADGNIDVSASPTHVFTLANSYAVKHSLINDIGCISDTVSKTIIENALPIADFTISSPNCVSLNNVFTDASSSASGNVVKWTWDLGDGASAATGNISHNYSSAGSYDVSLKVQSDKGCTSRQVTRTVVIHPLPLAGFIVPDNCINDPYVQFKDSSSIADGSQSQFSYQWNFGDANANSGNPNTSTASSPQHKYSALGTYNVALTVTSNAGCPSSITQPFTINGAQPKSLFTVANENQLCSNNAVSIINNSLVDFGRVVKLDIYWDYANDPTNKTTVIYPAVGTTYTHAYPEFFTPSTKNYNITAVAYSGDNCLNTSSQTIILNATPQIEFGALQSICADVKPFQITQAGILNPISGTGVYSGTGVSSTGIFDPQTAGAGDHLVRYTFTGNNGCTNYKEQTVTVFAMPSVDAGPDKFVLEGGNSVLLASASGNNLNYVWSPSSYLNNPDILQPVVTPADDITYTLTVTSADGCKSSDQVFVKVLKTPTIPNTFSPNGDGVHDTWQIQYLESYPGCTVEIYNRYGQMVFRSVGYSKPWDGTLKGKPLPAGTYYYIINPKNGRKQMAGFVDIIR